MIRVLHIFNMMDNGGIEHFVMDRYRMIDRQKIQFDFLMTSPNEGYFDKEILSMGGKVYHTSPITKNPLKAFGEVVRIVKKNGYKIVHRHTGNAVAYIDLIAAKLGGANNLIMHSHNNSAERQGLHRLAKKFLSINCTRLACSSSAGEWLFGDKKFSVIPNAINVDNYRFDSDKREYYRRTLGLEGSFVVGHIGRFDKQKNHDFLIDVFYELLQIKPNSKLVCIGDGFLRPVIENKLKQLHIQDKVIFTGSINNVNEVINAFDAFCLPSVYEGFGIVLIEAQANGLQCITSANCVPQASNIANGINYIPLEDGPKVWAAALCRLNSTRNKDAADIIVSKGYDLKSSLNLLIDIYERN